MQTGITEFVSLEKTGGKHGGAPIHFSAQSDSHNPRYNVLMLLDDSFRILKFCSVFERNNTVAPHQHLNQAIPVSRIMFYQEMSKNTVSWHLYKNLALFGT